MIDRMVVVTFAGCDPTSGESTSSISRTEVPSHLFTRSISVYGENGSADRSGHHLIPSRCISGENACGVRINRSDALQMRRRCRAIQLGEREKGDRHLDERLNGTQKAIHGVMPGWNTGKQQIGGDICADLPEQTGVNFEIGVVGILFRGSIVLCLHRERHLREAFEDSADYGCGAGDAELALSVFQTLRAAWRLRSDSRLRRSLEHGRLRSAPC